MQRSPPHSAISPTSEPTSPALLLIRQARETLGKNLYEVMKLLAPPHADAARVSVGPDGAFTVPVKSLSNAPSAAIPTAPAEPASRARAASRLSTQSPAHMQKAEPSSPVPYLLDRARNLATRDFVSLSARRPAGGGDRGLEEGEVILTSAGR